MAEPFLSIQHVRKSFGLTTVVQDFNLDVEPGEFVSFLGPSGCGKTTVLRMVAGFEEPSAGKIVVAGKDITRLKPNQRNVGMVFQAYALFPNLTVAQNIGFGLKVAGMPKTDADRRVAEMLDLIKLPQMGDRYPYQLSGGQQQRIALARAIAPKPKLLLLDEPLSALDAKVRVSLREEIRSIQKRLGITTIFVTHDQEEALTMSDRVGILRDGRLVQEGPPEEIYDRPKSEFAATFLGDANIFRGETTGAGIRLPDGTAIAAAAGATLAAGARASCAVRPERIRMGTDSDVPDQARANMLKGRVSKRIFAGNSSTYFVDRDGLTLKVIVQNTGIERLAEGQEVVLHWSPESTVLIATGD